MASVFADTCYWLALFNSKDGLHRQATKFAQSTAAEIFTSEMVLIEFLNATAEANPIVRASAASFVTGLIQEPQFRVVPVTSAQFWSAHSFYLRMGDKEWWSLVDCASFLIMKAHRIAEALTNDRHFTQAGFRALLR